MPTPENFSDYPDVLGTITGGLRLNVEVVQCAFTVYPRATALGQPFEALILLQNACDKPVQVAITLQLPRKDTNGQRMSLVTGKDEILVGMQPGETGLVHVPVVPHPPTQASQGNVMSARFQVKTPRGYKMIRQADGGRAPTALNMSPFRLGILREVAFGVNVQEPGVLTAPFDVIPGHVDMIPPAEARYETLWSSKELQNEQLKYNAFAAEAERFAGMISRTLVMEPLIKISEQRFAQAGMPIHPGEALFIAKAITYVMEDGLDLEDGFSLKTGRWFNRLISIVSDKYMTDDEDRLVSFLYTAAVHDAVRVGLGIVERAARKKFGTPEEHSQYADEVVSVLEGNKGIDMGHAYLPLILGGILLNQQIKGLKENLWTSLAQVREAWRGRLRLMDSTFEPIAQMMDQFVHEQEQQLYRARVPRPDGT
jgi:hypothetical protein